MAIRPGKRPRLTDIAHAAGVSRQTVSAVLKGGRTSSRASRATRERVRAAAARMGYRPWQTARADGARGRIALLCETLLIHDSCPVIVQGALNGLARRGFVGHLSFIGANQNFDEELDEIIESGVHAVMAVDRRLFADPDRLRRVCERLPASVFYGCGEWAPEDFGRHVVDVDRRAAAAMATRHLLDAGRRRIGFVSGEFPSHQQRYEGYESELLACGMHPQPDFILMSARHEMQPDGRVVPPRILAAQTIHQLLDKGKVDAILSGTGNQAFTVAMNEELRKRGLRAGRDVALIAISDAAVFESLRPAISAVRLRHENVPEAMVARLEELLSGAIEPGDAAPVYVTPELVHRESS